VYSYVSYSEKIIKQNILISFCYLLQAIITILKFWKFGTLVATLVLSDIWGSDSSACKESYCLGCDNLVDWFKFFIRYFSTVNLETVGSSIFMVETDGVASSKTFVIFYQSLSRKMILLKNWGSVCMFSGMYLVYLKSMIGTVFSH